MDARAVGLAPKAVGREPTGVWSGHLHVAKKSEADRLQIGGTLPANSNSEVAEPTERKISKLSRTLRLMEASDPLAMERIVPMARTAEFLVVLDEPTSSKPGTVVKCQA